MQSSQIPLDPKVLNNLINMPVIVEISGQLQLFQLRSEVAEVVIGLLLIAILQSISQVLVFLLPV